jgi:hypothetical protein
MDEKYRKSQLWNLMLKWFINGNDGKYPFLSFKL